MTKESVNEQRPSTLYFNWISRLEYLKIFELFCFSLKHKGFLSSPDKKVVLSRSFWGFFASLKSSFFKFGKILPHPREFDHHFLPRGRELDKKICPGGRDSLAQKNFPRGCPGGGCTQLELHHNGFIVMWPTFEGTKSLTLLAGRGLPHRNVPNAVSWLTNQSASFLLMV